MFCIAEKLHATDHRRVSESLHKIQVGRRLREAIEALGISQAEVAHALNVSASKLGNWLRGDNYPAAWFVVRFCDRYGITTEWLYRGIVTGLPARLADALWSAEQAARQEIAPPRRPREPDRPRPIRGETPPRNEKTEDCPKVVRLPGVTGQ